MSTKIIKLLCGSLLCLLSACSDDTYHSPQLEGNSSFSPPIPRAILQARIASSDLTLVVTVGGETVPMVRTEDDQWTGSISIPAGQTTSVSVTWLTNGIELATLETQIVAPMSNQNLAFSSNDYDLVDTDGDDVPNIEELDANPPTDVNDPDSFPVTGVQGPANLTDINPSSLNLGALVQESEQASVSFRNSGDSTLEYVVSSDQSWLSVNPASGSVAAGGSGSIEVTAECDSNPSTRTGSLTIDGGEGGSLNVPVSIMCDTQPMPILSVNPNSLSITGFENEATDAATLTISNVGTSQMNFSVVGAVELNVQPESGTVPPGESQTLTVGAFCNQGVGTFTYSLNIEGNFDSNPSIPVSVNCNRPVPIFQINESSYLRFVQSSIVAVWDILGRRYDSSLVPNLINSAVFDGQSFEPGVVSATVIRPEYGGTPSSFLCELSGTVFRGPPGLSSFAYRAGYSFDDCSSPTLEDIDGTLFETADAPAGLFGQGVSREYDISLTSPSSRITIRGTIDSSNSSSHSYSSLSFKNTINGESAEFSDMFGNFDNRIGSTGGGMFLSSMFGLSLDDEAIVSVEVSISDPNLSPGETGTPQVEGSFTISATDGSFASVSGPLSDASVVITGADGSSMSFNENLCSGLDESVC